MQRKRYNEVRLNNDFQKSKRIYVDKVQSVRVYFLLNEKQKKEGVKIVGVHYYVNGVRYNGIKQETEQITENAVIDNNGGF